MQRRPLHFAAPLVAFSALFAACNGITGVNDLSVEGGPTGNGAGAGTTMHTGNGAASGTGATGQGGAGTGTTTHTGSGAGGTGASAGASSSSGASSSGASSSTGSSSSSGSSSSGTVGDPEPPDMVGMTAAHNAARAAVMPVANPSLPQMTWSSTIAAVAQAWTNNCVFADTNNGYGSNAFAGTGTYTPAQVVDAWVSEDASYDYATNTCASGAQCGHYTQVVWRDSTQLGCGLTTCTKNNPFGGSGSWQLWVCNYNPPGNYVGESPY